MTLLFTSFFDALKPAAQTATLFSHIFPSTLWIAAYVILGLALMALCRATGIGKIWMSWVPFANLYLVGLLADTYTDNYLTTDEDRAAPFYAPSRLRRNVLGCSIGASVTGAATAVASLIISGFAALGLIMIMAAVPGMEEFPLDLPPYADVLLLVSGLVAFAAGIFCLVFVIMFLVSWCPALYRVLTALSVPYPALWTALGVFVPLAAVIPLLIYAKRKGIRTAFVPPPRESAEACAEKEFI